MNWKERIAVDPRVCKGRACVAGTRIPVSVVLDNLAAGLPEHELVASYPPLTREDIQACLAYAAVLAHEEIVPLARSGSHAGVAFCGASLWRQITGCTAGEAGARNLHC